MSLSKLHPVLFSPHCRLSSSGAQCAKQTNLHLLFRLRVRLNCTRNGDSRQIHTPGNYFHLFTRSFSIAFTSKDFWYLYPCIFHRQTSPVFPTPKNSPKFL